MAVLASLLTPMIAVITTYIAYQQYRTNKLKVRLDLFERRIEVYNIIRAFLVDVCEAKPQDLVNFLRRTRDAHFLFGSRAAQYVTKVYKQANTLQTCQMLLESRRADDEAFREKQAKRQEQLILWFSEQEPHINKVFAGQLLLAEEPSPSGMMRLAIVSSVLWLSVTSGVYLFVLLAAPLSVVQKFHALYQWDEVWRPTIDWPTVIWLVVLPVLLPWLVYFVVRAIGWIRDGFQTSASEVKE
jgi:hypothetical protein